MRLHFPDLIILKKILFYHTLKLKNKWPIKKLLKHNMRKYERRMGYSFDYQAASSFTEKIQVYKFFHNNPIIPSITDKVLFKKYVEDNLGPGLTIKMYGSWKKIVDLERDWDSLPNEFVLKSNLQGDGKMIRFIHDKSTIDFHSLKKKLKKWLNPRYTLVDSFDCYLFNSTPQILAEEYKANYKDQLYDYKFFCFDGVVHCIYVAQNHFGECGSYISFYDTEWNKLDVQYGHHRIGNASKPVHFDQMMEISIKISNGFPFVRVDFFDTDEQPYLAEMTFNPGGGYVNYYPESFNDHLGELFHLPSYNLNKSK